LDIGASPGNLASGTGNWQLVPGHSRISAMGLADSGYSARLAEHGAVLH